MKKLKLDLDKIEVYSFDVETRESGLGTVKGYSTTFNSIELCGGGSNALDSCDSCFPRDCPQMPITWGC